MAMMTFEQLEAENAQLKMICAKIMPCHYCGVTQIAKCPHGFPGCALADDLLVGDMRLAEALQAERAKFKEAKEGLTKITMLRTYNDKSDAKNIALQALTSIWEKYEKDEASRNPSSSSPTGRLSASSAPNIQNIPIRTPEGQKIREAILKAELTKEDEASVGTVEKT